MRAIADPSIALVLASITRTEEPRDFLSTLEPQTYRAFRVIVVDQNADDRLSRLLSDFHPTFDIRYLRSEPGLSRARNCALDEVRDVDVVAFPDDDCRYPPELLARVAAFLGTHPEWDGLCGRSVDDSGRPSNSRWDSERGRITPLNVWTRSTSYTIFLRRQFVERVGVFDEQLGVGARTPWGAAEEMDYLIRGMRLGCSLLYDPSLEVIHPLTREGTERPDPAQGSSYARGMGAVMRKHRLPLWFVLYQWIRGFGGAALALVQGRFELARFFWAVGVGRMQGWFDPPKKSSN